MTAQLHTLKQIEHEIQILESHLLTLKRKRNSLMALCRVPSDILVHVLQAVRMSFRPHMTKSDHYNERVRAFATDHETHDFCCNFAWLRMTDICSHIREVAITAPELWTIIDVRAHEQSVALHVLRAATVPLIMSFEHAPYNRALAATQYIDRAKAARFDLVRKNMTMKNLLSADLLTKAASNLKILHVSGLKGAEVLHALSRMSVGLEELYICSSRLDDSPENDTQWSNLRSVRLQNNRIGTHVLSALLSRMPGIQYLSIIDVYEDARSLKMYESAQGGKNTLAAKIIEEARPSVPPSMPYLRHVVLHVQMSSTIAVLRTIAELIRSTNGATQNTSQNITLDIKPLVSAFQPILTTFSRSTTDYLPLLVVYLFNEWNSIWNPATAIISATLLWTLSSLRDANEPLALITATFPHHPESRPKFILRMPYAAVQSILTHHDIVVSCLTVMDRHRFKYIANINNWTHLIPTNTPNLTSLKFVGLSRLTHSHVRQRLDCYDAEVKQTLSLLKVVDFENSEDLE
jgi:hypothetical protein